MGTEILSIAEEVVSLDTQPHALGLLGGHLSVARRTKQTVTLMSKSRFVVKLILSCKKV